MGWSSDDKGWRDYKPPAGSRSTRPDDTSIPAAPKVPKANKFHAVKTVAADGTPMDSGHEAKVYQDLLYRERAGELTELQRQVAIPLIVNGQRITTIRVDFVYRDRATGALVYLEAKSDPTRTRAYGITRKLFTALMGASVTEA